MMIRASVVILLACVWKPALGEDARQHIALIGGTVIDVSNWGRGANDIDNATVLISGGRIATVGRADEVAVPMDAERVDVRGRYIIPGLIDGFAAINNQAYANAYLYMGITSIISVDGGRRGPLFTTGHPSPRIYPLESVGDDPKPIAELIADLEKLHRDGKKIALLKYQIKPGQLRPLVERAVALGMGTIGELGLCTYAEGIDAGVDAFVHTTRYSLDLAPTKMRQAVADHPFSDDLDSPKWLYYKMLSELKPDDPRIASHARTLARGKAALMPTLALLYLDQPFATNPWDEPIAHILDPGDINNPANRLTGRHEYDTAHSDAYEALGQQELTLERVYCAAKARYLAGSATDVWGTMPGISLHQELDMLHRIGLSPRQVLAAATANISEAFRWEGVGQIKAGYRADLVVLDADPRESVAHLERIRTVLLDGRPLDRRRLAASRSRSDGDIVEQHALAIPDECLEADDGARRLKKGFDYLASVQMYRIAYMSDGFRIMGYLVEPKGPGPFPSVIYNRGGNREFGKITPRRVAHHLARMASWGYVVVASQYRGNDGGEGIEEFGGAEVNDVMHLIPLLERHPKADASRLAMYGGSRGGLMTYLALARTDRIKAAAIRCGVSDLTGWKADRPEMVSVFADLIPEFDPTDDRTLHSRSPIRWAEKLCPTAPILLMQGTADWRVNPASALRMAERLLELSHPFRLVMFEGSDHGLNEHSYEANQLVHEWFDRYVREETPLPNMEPHGS